MVANPTTVVQAFLSQGSLPLSRSIHRVQGMLHRADYAAGDLAEQLRLDPTLATRVMAVANSSFFSRSPCGSIEEAVNRLGTAQLTRIFAQVLANAAMVHPLAAYGLPADAMWRRSVLAAVGAEMAATRIGEDHSGAYLVGLLHQVGMLVVDSLWRRQTTQPRLTFTGFEGEWSGSENRLGGCDQAVLGAEVLKQLGFPPAVVNAVARQYRRPLEPVERALYVGRLVRSTLCDAVPPAPDLELLREFKLASDTQLEGFVNDAREEVQQMMTAA